MIVVREADGSECVYVSFGLTDEELDNDELMQLLIDGEDEKWLLSA
ncbi:hypothetical protein ACE103_08670 [Bradyrhizobium sp. ma5]